MEKVTIEEMNLFVGGKGTRTNDLIVSLNYTWPKDLLHTPYRAEGSAIIFCLSGNIKISVNTRELEMRSGAVMVYGRESIVEFLEISDDCRVHLIFFSNNFAKETMLDLKSVLPIVKYISENLGQLMLLNEVEIRILGKFYELMYDLIDMDKASVLHDVMTAFIRTLGEFYNRRINETQHTRTRQEEYMENFLKQIAIHHKKERSVKFYADALYITPKYLSTVIKEISGKSAASWINDFVVQEAKALLRFSGKSIQEIAYELNFSTQSFFGKYFKRHTGLSPSEYRMAE